MAGAVEARVIDRNGQQFVVFPDGTEVPMASVQSAMTQQADYMPPPRADVAFTPTVPTTGSSYQFGDVGRDAGNEALQAAYAQLAGAVNPQSRNLLDVATNYATGTAGGLLSGAIGLGQKAGGYAADVLGAGAEALGSDRWSRGGAAQALYGDMQAGGQSAGLGTEARMLDAITSLGAVPYAADAADLTARSALANAKSLTEGDIAFLRAGGTPQSLSAGTPNLGGVLSLLGNVPESAIENAVPFKRTSGFAAPRSGGGRAKDPALYSQFSPKKQSVVPPSDWEVSGRRLTDLISNPDALSAEEIRRRGFTDMYGFPADSTMGNAIIDEVNGLKFPKPVLQQAGHEFTDNTANLGFMSDRGVLSGKNREWQKVYEQGGKPLVTPMTMGTAGGDFNVHQSMNLAQAIRAAAENGMIDPNFVPMGGTKKAPYRLLPEGMGLLDPRLPAYIESMNGGQRANFAKALDTPMAMESGVPSVGAIRWASMDPNLIGSEALSSGYRLFQPEQSDFLSFPNSHSSYNAAVDRVGNSMTMGNARPFRLMFPDEAFSKLEASTRRGANMIETQAKPKDLRAFQMNPKLSQKLDNEWEDANMMYDKIMNERGSDAADLYATDALIARANRRAMR
jgi:hypothetical protein